MISDLQTQLYSIVKTLFLYSGAKRAQTKAFSNPPFLRPWEEAGVINV